MHARLTRQVLATTDAPTDATTDASTDASAEPEDRVITWQDQNAIALSRAASMLEEIVDTDGPGAGPAVRRPPPGPDLIANQA